MMVMGNVSVQDMRLSSCIRNCFRIERLVLKPFKLFAVERAAVYFESL